VWSITASLALAVGYLGAQDKDATTQPAQEAAVPAIETVALTVVSEAGKKSGLVGLYYSGTSLSFVLNDPQRYLTYFDVRASRIESLLDDKGKDLTPATSAAASSAESSTKPASAASAASSAAAVPAATLPASAAATKPAAPLMAGPPFAVTPGFTTYWRLLGGNHQLVFGVFSPAVPSKGAAAIHVRGSLVLHFGLSPKEAEQRNVQLVKGAKISAGPLEADIVNVGTYPTGKETQQTYLQLSPAKEVEAIRKVTFFDAKGVELETSFFAGSGPVRPGEPPTHRTIIIKGNAQKGTLKVTYFSRIEILTVPLDKTVSVGL